MAVVKLAGECAKAVWRKRDQGIWKPAASPSTTRRRSRCAGSRSTGRSKLAHIRGERDLAGSWAETAEEIRSTSTRRRCSRALRQHYATDSLDASTSRRCSGSCRADDDRLRKVLAIATSSAESRCRATGQRPGPRPSGKEDVRDLLVLALSRRLHHRRGRARDHGATRQVAPPLSALREVDVDNGRHLGNFPQAFSIWRWSRPPQR